MNIEIQENKKELQVIIECCAINEHVSRLKKHIELFDSRLQGKAENEICMVNVSDVLYFETVDGRMFLYTDEKVMEIKHRLYELETILPGQDFIRISKSQIVNISKIKTLKPELNRTILATMCNGEKIYVSRKYVKQFKELLAI